MDMNVIVVSGRVATEIDLRYTKDGAPYARFNIACERMPKPDGSKEVDFIPIVVWNKKAENTAGYSGKGLKVLVQGKLRISSYDDKDGNKRKNTEIVADQIQFLEFRQKNQQPSDGYDQQNQQNGPQNNNYGGPQQQNNFNNRGNAPQNNGDGQNGRRNQGNYQQQNYPQQNNQQPQNYQQQQQPESWGYESDWSNENIPYNF